MINRPLTMLFAAGALALTASGGQSESATSSASAPDPENVVARVNGTAISEVQLDAQVQAMSQRGQAVERSRALDELIDLTLMAQKAESQGLPEQPEIAASIERQRATTLAQHLIRAQLSEFDVTEDKLRQAYQEKVSGMNGTEYKARHILLEDEKTARSLIEQLGEGADFAALAKEHSTGPTASRGGDLGWFSTDQMVQPFADAVQALEPGSHSSEPVQTQFGWHVIRLEETRPVEKPAFDQMKQQLRNELIGQQIRTYLESLRSDAKVEIVAEDLQGNTDAASAADEMQDAAAEGTGSGS